MDRQDRSIQHSFPHCACAWIALLCICTVRWYEGGSIALLLFSNEFAIGSEQVRSRKGGHSNSVHVYIYMCEWVSL